MSEKPAYLRAALEAAREQSAEAAPKPSVNGASSVHVAADEYPEDQRGDAWEDPRDRTPPAGEDLATPPNRFRFVSSAEFAAADFRLDWLVKRLLVRGQPAVIGGPRKALKTSVLIDLALSLGSGSPFLGRFDVAPARVAVMSGESGQATIQETAQRIAAAKGIDFATANVLWEFRLPQLADPAQLAELQDAIGEAQADVLILDPLYLSLLSGMDHRGPSASNVYEMGPPLLGIANACLSVGCTPCLAHHFRLGRGEGEPQLEDRAYSGIQEFSRQWLLLGRREAYEPGSGQHRMWLSVGGSAGQSGLWSLDVDEGALGDDFSGRKWEVSISTATETRESERELADRDRREREATREREDDDVIMRALDAVDPTGQGTTLTSIRGSVSISRSRYDRAIFRLRAAKLIEGVKVVAEIGSGAKRSCDGIRRPPS